jgi:predicted amidohydrolase YtcJ
VQHINQATPEILQRLKNLNCGVSMSGFRWLQGNVAQAPLGSPFRMVLDSGIPAGMHEDGVHIAPHNPWFALHYATTGLNVFGEQINPDQQITRQEALRCYTRGNAWYLNREDKLGSIEVGKLADLLVLDRDYFSVSDADMRETRPVLTVVDGKIGYDTGVV